MIVFLIFIIFHLRPKLFPYIASAFIVTLVSFHQQFKEKLQKTKDEDKLKMLNRIIVSSPLFVYTLETLN